MLFKFVQSCHFYCAMSRGLLFSGLSAGYLAPKSAAVKRFELNVKYQVHRLAEKLLCSPVTIAGSASVSVGAVGLNVVHSAVQSFHAITSSQRLGYRGWLVHGCGVSARPLGLGSAQFGYVHGRISSGKTCSRRPEAFYDCSDRFAALASGLRQ